MRDSNIDGNETPRRQPSSRRDASCCTAGSCGLDQGRERETLWPTADRTDAHAGDAWIVTTHEQQGLHVGVVSACLHQVEWHETEVRAILAVSGPERLRMLRHGSQDLEPCQRADVDTLAMWFETALHLEVGAIVLPLVGIELDPHPANGPRLEAALVHVLEAEPTVGHVILKANPEDLTEPIHQETVRLLGRAKQRHQGNHDLGVIGEARGTRVCQPCKCTFIDSTFVELIDEHLAEPISGLVHTVHQLERRVLTTQSGEHDVPSVWVFLEPQSLFGSEAATKLPQELIDYPIGQFCETGHSHGGSLSLLP